MNSKLSRAQDEIKKSVQFKSWAFAIIAALIIGVVVIQFLPADPFVRGLFFILAAAVVTKPLQKIIHSWVAADSRCKACHAPFAIERTDSQREFVSAIPRKQIKKRGVVGGHGPDVGKDIIEHQSWTEERYKITDTFTCVKCGDAQQTSRIQTRREGYSSTTLRR